MDAEKHYRMYMCGNVHCRANGATQLLALLEETLWFEQLNSEAEVRVSGCQNRCESGPNLTIWPGPFRYTRLSPEGIRRIVTEHLRGGVPVRDLLSGDEQSA